MRYFIDCGGHNGSSIKRFRSKHDPGCKAHVISFEVEPSLFKCYDHIPNHTLIKKAVWIEDGEILFYRDSDERMERGGLIKKEDPLIHTTEPIVVETIDISKWLFTNFSRVDQMFFKLSIEGAEYHVIPRMVRDATFRIIKTFYCKWNWDTVGISEEQHKLIKEMVPKASYGWGNDSF